LTGARVCGVDPISFFRKPAGAELVSARPTDGYGSQTRRKRAAKDFGTYNKALQTAQQTQSGIIKDFIDKHKKDP
jgi:hypothetical protein